MSHEHRFHSAGEIAPVLLPRWVQICMALILLGAIGAVVHWYQEHRVQASKAEARASRPSPHEKDTRVLTPAELATITIELVQARTFHDEIVTEGKLAVDEDQTTPIFSPYSGRVINLFAKPGEQIKAGQPLFSIQAAEMVQAQNDFLAGISGVNKAKSQLGLAQIVERRQAELYQAKAVALKEWQTAKNDLTAAQNDLKTAEVGLEAARNRLRILGKSDQEITTFQQNGLLDPETVINAPIAGTIIQRKVGPGQYVNAGSGDPAFTTGDLSRIWLIAQVREADASRIAVGQKVDFTVLAYADRSFSGQVTYVASSVDPQTRRILVRAEIDNREGLLKPEMYANVDLVAGRDRVSPAVHTQAVVYEGDQPCAWVVADDRSVHVRHIKGGIVSGPNLEVLEGLSVGERVVTKGSLFVDRVVHGDD